MQWYLTHQEVTVKPDTSEVLSKAKLVLVHNGVEIVLAELVEPENHALGSKKVLVDTAYKLQKLAHEMLNKADKVN
jgi:hypothetical protein